MGLDHICSLSKNEEDEDENGVKLVALVLLEVPPDIFDFNLPEVIHAVQEAETFPSISRAVLKPRSYQDNDLEDNLEDEDNLDNEVYLGYDDFPEEEDNVDNEVCPIIMVLFKDCSSFDKKYLIVTKESNDAKEVDMNAS
ncbi:hypothetical protein CFP56_043486 [Quercus suber]|uniref:Uncharacterized protein n=1 Tax=Quercus suber TaxID=58331 RepID=A0AAW0LHW6_QUESU